MSGQYILLGRLARPHALRGEIRVDYYAQSPQLLDKPLLLRAGSQEPVPAQIGTWRMLNGQPVIKLTGVDDRTAAELLRGRELLIRQSDLPVAEADEPYLADILGLEVFLPGAATPLGILADVMEPSGQEIWVIQSQDGAEILLPAVPEYVQDIDLAAESIIINPPPGLLDLYLGGGTAPNLGSDAASAPSSGALATAALTTGNSENCADPKPV